MALPQGELSGKMGRRDISCYETRTTGENVQPVPDTPLNKTRGFQF